MSLGSFSCKSIFLDLDKVSAHPSTQASIMKDMRCQTRFSWYICYFQLKIPLYFKKFLFSRELLKRFFYGKCLALFGIMLTGVLRLEFCTASRKGLTIVGNKHTHSTKRKTVLSSLSLPWLDSFCLDSLENHIEFHSSSSKM